MGTMVVAPGPGSGTEGSVLSDSLVPGGKICVPPAYVQPAGDAAIPLTSAHHKVAFGFTPEVDFALDALSLYVTAVGTPGSLAVDIFNDGEALQPAGEFNSNFLNVAPTAMTANSSPSPFVVALRDKNGANAEAVGFEAYRGFDGSLAVSNGIRSNAIPTPSDPIYLTLDFGSGNAKAINRFWFHSFYSTDVNVRAFPKAFTLWASTIESPTVNTDADWTQLTGLSSWTAETDPGNIVPKEYCVNNTITFRHYRWKITDRNGSNAYVAFGEVKLFEADVQSSPDSLIQSLGSMDVGATPDVWIRHAFAPCQLQRGKKYWIVFTGEDSKDFSLSKRRFTQAAGSMFPDGCETKESADSGAAWTPATQTENSVVRKAMLNVILQSTVHHATQLVFGRMNGPSVSLSSGSEWVPRVIPPGGISLNCEALIANSRYYVYLSDSAGTLTLEASPLAPSLHDGMEVEPTSPAKRFVGIAGMVTIRPGYQGPLDLPDARLVRNRYNTVVKVGTKDPGYLGQTSWSVAALMTNKWLVPFDNNDLAVRLVSWEEAPPVTAFVVLSANQKGRLGVAVDGCLPQDHCTVGHQSSGLNMTTALRLNTKINLRRGFHLLYLVLHNTGTYELCTTTTPWCPQAGIAIELLC
jgi:hypothetical protein